MYRYLIAFQHRVTRLCADNPYGIALWLSFGFCIAHVLALPLLVTFDGYSYAKLAEAIGTARFEQDWDYLRGPVFPLLLKASFGLFGRNALTVIALQSTLGFGGICLIGATLKRWGRPLEAAATVMVLSAFPTLVTYEHALLTEAGTFFFLALLVYVVTAPLVTPWKPAFELAGVLAVGYYHRSSLLCLTPVVAVVYALRVYQKYAPAGRLRGVPLRHLIGGTVVVALLPLAAAYPWQRTPRVRERTDAAVLIYGLLKQTVVPADDPALGADDPALGPAATDYRTGIDRSLIGGSLPLSGVRDQFVYGLVEAIRAHAPHGPALLPRVVFENPGRYSTGVLRTLLLFAGLDVQTTDSQLFRSQVLATSGSAVMPRPPGYPPLDTELARPASRSIVTRLLLRASPVYDLLILFAVLVSVAFLGLGFYRKDAILLAFVGLPLSFLLVNALVLSSQDRMAVPAYPLLLAALVLLPGEVRPLRVASPEDRTLPTDRYAFPVLIAFLVLLAGCHLTYLLRSAMIPSSDEANYMSGVYGIGQGLRSGSLRMAIRSYITALGFKAPLICVPAAFLSLAVGDIVLASKLSLVLIFVALGIAAYSLFRNLFAPTLAAFASAVLVTAPVVTGLSHRFYVENLLLLITIVYLDLLIRFGIRSLSRTIVLGLVAGLGLLVKSTFAAIVFLPTLLTLFWSYRSAASRTRYQLTYRLALFGSMAGAVAMTWYAYNWRATLALGKIAVSCAECDYPVIRTFLAGASASSYFFVSLVALVGVLPLVCSLFTKETPQRQVQAWAAILLSGAVVVAISTTTTPKNVRYMATVLPLTSALVVYSAVRWFRKDRILVSFLSAIVFVSVALVAQNSFELFPIADIRIGDLRLFDSRYPLNTPDWFDDNHPVDRRDFRLDQAALLFHEDSVSRNPPGRLTVVGLLVHGLLINHDYLNLLSQMRGESVLYNPFYLTSLTGPGAPDYVLTCLGCGGVYPGRHYYDPYPDFVRRVKARSLPYQEIFEFGAPAGCRFLGFRRTEQPAEESTIMGLKLLPRTTAATVDSISGATGPGSAQITVVRRRPLEVVGWAVDLPNRQPAKGVVIELDGKAFRAHYGELRPDVGAALGNDVYAASGFSAIIPITDLQPGSHSLSIDILDSSENGYYRGQQFALDVR